MSVLIKMEMPPNCMLCNFCVPEADEANGEMCTVTGKLMPPCNHERLDDCPLVPVPPHGRLIDADAMFKDICDDINEMTAIGLAVDGQWMWGKLNDALENAPTIIEAEEE